MNELSCDLLKKASGSDKLVTFEGTGAFQPGKLLLA